VTATGALGAVGGDRASATSRVNSLKIWVNTASQLALGEHILGHAFGNASLVIDLAITNL
jgi:hypothetical protein